MKTTDNVCLALGIEQPRVRVFTLLLLEISAQGHSIEEAGFSSRSDSCPSSVTGRWAVLRPSYASPFTLCGLQLPGLPHTAEPPSPWSICWACSGSSWLQADVLCAPCLPHNPRVLRGAPAQGREGSALAGGLPVCPSALHLLLAS